MTLRRCYDARKYRTDAILFREIQFKKKDILIINRFQCEFGRNKVKYARITITHVCFIALTNAGSLGRCLTTRPVSLVFKQLFPDLANVNAWQNMCDPYNHTGFWLYIVDWMSQMFDVIQSDVGEYSQVHYNMKQFLATYRANPEEFMPDSLKHYDEDMWLRKPCLNVIHRPQFSLQFCYIVGLYTQYIKGYPWNVLPGTLTLPSLVISVLLKGVNIGPDDWTHSLNEIHD